MQGRRTEIGVNDVARLAMGFRDPFCELHGIGNGGGEEDVADLIGKQNDGLFPDNTTLLVAHVVDLVEHDPRHLAHDLGAAVEHGASSFDTYLSRHNQTGRGGVYGDITSHKADVAKLGHEFSVFLVTERLDRTGVDDSLIVLETLCDGVFCHNCLSGRGMRRH